MPDIATACPDCRTPYSLADNYCRECGMFLAAVHETALTTNTATRAVSVARPTLPAPVKRMATAVVVGGALRIGVGLAAKYIAAQGAQRANRAVASPRKSRALAAVAEPPMTAISETVVIRRVWLRRG